MKLLKDCGYASGCYSDDVFNKGSARGILARKRYVINKARRYDSINMAAQTPVRPRLSLTANRVRTRRMPSMLMIVKAIGQRVSPAPRNPPFSATVKAR